MGTTNLPNPLGSLDRHQQRRAAGLPTVSVLRGLTGCAVREGRRWADATGRPIVRVDNPQFESLLDAWVDHLAAGRDLARDAVAWLAGRSERPVSTEQLASRVGRMTPSELSAFLDSVATESCPSDAGRACGWLLERWLRGEPIVGQGLATRLGEAFSGSDVAENRERVFVALGEMIPQTSDPVLLLARGGAESEPMAWLESAARSLTRLALVRPDLPLILAIEAGELDEYDRKAPESRAKTLIRAGVIAVSSSGEDETAPTLDPEIPRADSRPGSLGPSRPDVREDDAARSAAERFLFDRLESFPETAGLFALNATLDFRFGPTRAMEVDLVSGALALAVEIDGYYHFLDADAYRRDRRKDLELQRRGYLVVRFLAEDVVSRLEEVLSVILDAVAIRRGRDHRQEGERS